MSFPDSVAAGPACSSSSSYIEGRAEQFVESLEALGVVKLRSEEEEIKHFVNEMMPLWKNRHDPARIIIEDLRLCGYKIVRA